MQTCGSKRGGKGLSVAKNFKSGDKKLAKCDLVSEVTVGVFKQSYEFFMALKRKTPILWRKSAFEYVRECTGLIPGTFKKYLYGTRDLPMQDTADDEKIVKGPAPCKITPDVLMAIRLQVKKWNTDGKRPKAVTKQRIVDFLKKEHNISVTPKSLRRHMKRAGFIFGKGNRQHYAHELPNIVKLRHIYIHRMHQLRQRRKGCRFYRQRPLIVLDESYVNENYIEEVTWYHPDDGDLPTVDGAGRRLCIVGAGIYYHDDTKLCAGWVRGSVSVFEGGQDKRKKRKATDPNDPLNDYHGNFNAVMFELWFIMLCKNAKEDHGPCDIKLDGAGYHKRNTTKTPTSASKKEEMKLWLEAKSISIPEPATKAVLYGLIKENKPPPSYRVWEIAKEYGHRVIFTPPYHPELQEIEVIWACAKQYCKKNPAGTFKELKNNILHGLNEVVTVKTWKGVHRKVWDFEDVYHLEMASDPLIELDKLSGIWDDEDGDGDN